MSGLATGMALASKGGRGGAAWMAGTSPAMTRDGGE
jgi:hypothetical protein